MPSVTDVHSIAFLLWLFKGKIEKLEKQTQLLDSAEFKKNKTYRFILLQVNSLQATPEDG